MTRAELFERASRQSPVDWEVVGCPVCHDYWVIVEDRIFIGPSAAMVRRHMAQNHQHAPGHPAGASAEAEG